jgi:hypothetical protein
VRFTNWAGRADTTADLTCGVVVGHCCRE